MPAIHAGTENTYTIADILAAVPQPKDVNDVDASSEPSDDETCDEDVVCRYCESWRNMKVDSQYASRRWLKKRIKKKEAQVKKSEK